MTKIVKIASADQRTRAYAHFVDDLGGYVCHLMRITGKSPGQLAAVLGVSRSTVVRLAERDVGDPHLSTAWKVLKGADDRGVIRHSMLEQYRPLGRPTLRQLRALQDRRAA